MTAVGGDDEEWKSGRRSSQEWAYLDIEGAPYSFRGLHLLVHLSLRPEEEEGVGRRQESGNQWLQRVSW